MATKSGTRPFVQKRIIALIELKLFLLKKVFPSIDTANTAQSYKHLLHSINKIIYEEVGVLVELYEDDKND